jgi:DNA-binding transcriptional MocR family regulator
MEPYNFALNYPLPNMSHADLIRTLADKLKSDPLSALRNVSEQKLNEYQTQMAKWLMVGPEQIAFGIGGHQIFSTIIQEFTLPGETMACEEITYNGWIEASKTLGRKLVSVKMDKEGMLPEALDEIAGKERIRGIFLMPSLHNPLNTIMPLERRKAIIEVCRRHELFVIDDDAYRFLNPNPPPSFAHLYPEGSFWIQSFTKIMFPSIKTGVVSAPPQSVLKLRSALRYQPPGLTLPWIMELILNGKMDEIIRGKQDEAKRRQATAAEILKGIHYQTFPTSFHLWVEVPEGWLPQNINVMPALRYFAGRGKAPSATRLTLAGESDPARMKEGLELFVSQLRP